MWDVSWFLLQDRVLAQRAEKLSSSLHVTRTESLHTLWGGASVVWTCDTRIRLCFRICAVKWAAWREKTHWTESKKWGQNLQTTSQTKSCICYCGSTRKWLQLFPSASRLQNIWFITFSLKWRKWWQCPSHDDFFRSLILCKSQKYSVHLRQKKDMDTCHTGAGHVWTFFSEWNDESTHWLIQF